MSHARAALAALLLAFAVAAPADAKVLAGPAGDAFYQPPSPLPGKRHGDAIWSSKLTGPAAIPGAVNRLVLYRSTSVNGAPTAVSGTISLPKGKAPKGGWPVVTYAHGTTGIPDQCAPSRDGGVGAGHAYSAYVFPLLERWLKAGYAVVRTDYEGLGTPGDHPYLIGVSEGRSTLDIVRAARQVERRLSARVIISGHSQGGHAALWAAGLAPKWTPELRVRGTVAFAPASQIDEQAPAARAIRNPSPFSGLIAIILRGVGTVRPDIDIPALLGDQAAALYPQTLTACLPDLNAPSSFGGIAPSDLLKPDADLSPLLKAIDDSDPDRLRIRTPVLIEQGESDNTVLKIFTDGLAKTYTKNKVPLTYHTYKNTDHPGIVVRAAADSTRWIRARLRR